MIRLIAGDALTELRSLPADSVHCCVTSPPYYGLRDYGVAGQIGLEPSPDEYVAALVAVFREARRVLRKDGTLWVNIGDSYAGGKTGRADHGVNDPTIKLQGNSAGAAHCGYAIQRPVPAGFKPKDLIGIPWMLAFALRADGWWLRQDIIWAKPNTMPESVTDRCTKAHEYIFLLSKRERYWFDADAIREEGEGYGRSNWNAPQFKCGDITRNHGGKGDHGRGGGTPTFEGGRNKRSVWTVASAPFAEAHFATFPPALIEPCILAGCPQYTCSKCGSVLDPYSNKGNRAGTNGHNVQAVREDIQAAAIGSEAQQLLQPGMQVRVPTHNETDPDLPLVRATGNTRQKSSGSQFLQQSLRFEMDREEPEHVNGTLHNVERLCGDLSAGSSECQQGRLHHGTPAGDRADNRPISVTERGRPSPRWQSAEQHRSEPRTVVENETRQDAESQNGHDPLPPLCGSDLTIAACPNCGASLSGIGAIAPGVVLDCFAGAGTTGLVADRLGRNAILIDLNPAYCDMARNRIADDAPLFVQFADAAD